MSTNIEYCDPFSGEAADIWMKLEHCGRYLFACDFLRQQNCRKVIDMAASNGYGSRLLADQGFRVSAADRNREYLNSGYFAGSDISVYCFDFDRTVLHQTLGHADAVVCFETIEHLKKPFDFIGQLPNIIVPGGWLLLSFPNEAFEKTDQDGVNLDPYHLHILRLEQVASALERSGFKIDKTLGQPFCNEVCRIQHDLRENGQIAQEDVDRAFHYDRTSILTLSRLLAYPQEERIENSYSYLITARKV